MLPPASTLLTTHLPSHLHGNMPAIFLLIAIRYVCDLPIKNALGATSPAGEQK